MHSEGISPPFPTPAPRATPPLPPFHPSLVETALDLWQAAGRRQWLTAAGTSMLPLIREGDHLLVDLSPFSPRPGDIVVARQANGLVAHRVIAIRLHGATYRILTQGDHVRWQDPPRAPADLLGRVIARSRGGQTIALDTRWQRIAGRAFVYSAKLTRWFRPPRVMPP